MNLITKCEQMGTRLKACEDLIQDLEDELTLLPIEVAIFIPTVNDDDIVYISWSVKEKHIMFCNSTVNVPLVCTTPYCKMVIFPYLEKLREKAKRLVENIETHKG